MISNLLEQVHIFKRIKGPISNLKGKIEYIFSLLFSAAVCSLVCKVMTKVVLSLDT